MSVSRSGIIQRLAANSRLAKEVRSDDPRLFDMAGPIPPVVSTFAADDNSPKLADLLS
jgi:hypothetical protein